MVSASVACRCALSSALKLECSPRRRVAAIQFLRRSTSSALDENACRLGKLQAAMIDQLVARVLWPPCCYWSQASGKSLANPKIRLDSVKRMTEIQNTS